jgi:predicted phosphate transport protein (TIGR00153 family)
MSPLRLMPKDERFFELFIADGENLLAAARELEALVTDYDRVEERVDAIRVLEHQGDEIGDDLTDKIERAFITPFDRGDIHELAARLDDVVDGIQEIAETFLLYGITRPTEEAKALARILLGQAEHLLDVLQKLESLKGMDDSLRAIHTLENQADGMSRGAIAGLFRGEPDAVEIIKWRDLYTYLEDTIDAAEDAGEIIERMVHNAT